jgi:transposase InsO family protein
LSGSAEVKYKGIVLLKSEGHSVSLCCELLEVSSSGYYDWRKRLPSNREIKNGEIKAKIVNIFSDSRKTYGVPRIKAALERSGDVVGKDRVARLMKEEGLEARRKKAFRPKTTINNPSDKKSERVFKIEETEVTKLNQVWVSDLTYIPTLEGFSYLVTVMDLFNREIIGWDLSDSMEAKHTSKALGRALANSEGKPNELIFHSDQGIQYCSGELRGRLELVEIIQSMSRKGNCYDNAFAESFFHTLKNELTEKIFTTKREARKVIFEYIECWYNTKRLHSSLGYMSPKEYAEKYSYAA